MTYPTKEAMCSDIAAHVLIANRFATMALLLLGLALFFFIRDFRHNHISTGLAVSGIAAMASIVIGFLLVGNVPFSTLCQ